MFNDNNGISTVGQAAKDLDQLVDIGKMKACSWLIQDINGLSGTALGKFGSKFDTLGFTTGKFGRWLSQTDITKTYIL